MATGITDEEREQHAIKFLVDSLGKPGFKPEDIAFLLKNPDYEHRPVGIREFIESPEYCNDRDCWPSVMRDLEEIFPLENIYSLRMSPYSEIAREMGIGSGKSYRIKWIFKYATYRLLCYKDPQRAYGLAANTMIALVNASVTATQAKRVVFGEIVNGVKNSPWFQRNAQPDPNIMSELRFPKNIVIFPGSSSETAPLGYSIFVGNIDEAAFFQDNTRDAAQDIYDALYNRELSRFSDFGIISAISSPNYEGDFIERKISESKLNPQVNGKVGPTWENNPKDVEAIKKCEVFTLEHPRTKEIIKIPLKYEKAFKRNPVKAWRDFGAVASLVMDPYFDPLERRRLETIVHAGWVVPKIDEIRPCGCGALYFAHIDLGIKRDACGFALGHVCRFAEKVRMDVIWRIVSRVRAGELAMRGEPCDMIIGDSQVQIGEVRGLIYTLSERGFHIQCVSYDQFQSLESRQDLESRGYQAKLISVDKDMKAYDTFKGWVNSDKLLCCTHNWFLVECSRLECKEGKKVDHPPGASKDCADAVAGVCRSIAESFDEEVIEEEVTIVDETLQYRPIKEDI